MYAITNYAVYTITQFTRNYAVYAITQFTQFTQFTQLRNYAIYAITLDGTHGRPYLGAAIGSLEYVEEYVKSNGKAWSSSINMLSL